MAVVYYVKVERSSYNGDELWVRNLDNQQDFQIRGHELVAACLSADQYQAEEKVTKTQAAEILISSYNRPFTVSFDKTDGTERTLRGRLVRPEPLLGRSMVEDLDATSKDRLRQVDHRTIHYIVVDGVKYTVK